MNDDHDLRMRRKIQQIGSSTLAVTLPADWAREQGVEKGDELVIQRDENGGSLLLVPDHPAVADTVARIDAGAFDGGSLENAVLAQYVLGRHLITVESEEPLDPDVLTAIDRIERRLMGLGVVERSPTHVDIRCSVAPGDFELPTLLERLWRTEAVMRENAIEAFLENDPEAAERALHYEPQLEKLFHLFLRLVFVTYRNPRLTHTMGLDTGFPLIGYRSVAQDIVLVAENACRIAGLVVDDGTAGPVDEEAREGIEHVASSLDTVVDATRKAIAEPTYERTTVAREALSSFETHVGAAQSQLEAERPEPLLELQRVLTTLLHSGAHVEDSLDVATHLAVRTTTSVETDYLAKED